MRLAWRLSCAVLALGIVTATAHAGSTYADANRAFVRGDYDEAARLYESLITAGVTHEDLYYNLGNAYFRRGQHGLAAYSYERALRLAPELADARHNLAVARDAAARASGVAFDAGHRGSSWPRVIAGVSTWTILWSFLIANAAFFASLLAWRRARARAGLKGLTASCAIAFAVSGIWLAAHIAYLETEQLGVVLPATIELRAVGDEAGEIVSRAHAATHVRVIGRDPGWLKVRLPSGREGWVPSQSIGLL